MTGTLPRQGNLGSLTSRIWEFDEEFSAEDWAQWRDHRRQQPLKLADIWPWAVGRRSPLTWGWDDASDAVDGEQLNRLWAVTRGKANVDILEASEALAADWRPAGDKPTTEEALTAVALAYALPELATRLAREAWSKLYLTMHELAMEAATAGAEVPPLVEQLLAAELPLVLACRLPELGGLPLGNQRAMAHALDELLDNDGMPHARLWPAWRPLLAVWTRCLALGQVLRPAKTKRKRKTSPPGHQILDAEHFHLYESLVLQALRMTRSDGSSVMSDRQPWNRSFLDAVLALGGDESCESIARFWKLPGSRERRAEVDPDDFPPPYIYSEWGQGTVMRTGWDASCPQFAASFAHGEMHLDFSHGRDGLWFGSCPPQVSIAGKPCPTRLDWEEVCWFDDTDVQYIELEAELYSGWKVQRQLLLSASDSFLFMADALLGDQEAEVRYQCEWPLLNQVARHELPETRELTLSVRDRDLALVMPLALSEWRATTNRGNLTAPVGGPLLLTQIETTRAMYCPLFIDLNRRRMAKECTWRQLTVGRALQQVPDWEAVGYRVQVGKRQWLFYRSLAPVDNRTVLGQNLMCEFLAARFLADGDVHHLLEIDGSLEA